MMIPFRCVRISLSLLCLEPFCRDERPPTIELCAVNHADLSNLGRRGDVSVKCASASARKWLHQEKCVSFTEWAGVKTGAAGLLVNGSQPLQKPHRVAEHGFCGDSARARLNESPATKTRANWLRTA